ncbi:MAG TPA: hypothetical protein VF405_00785 [Gammaproteobacteria bacterium]
MSNVTPLESDVDRELGAMRELWRVLEPLKPDARARVVAWLMAKSSPHPGFRPMGPPFGAGDELVGFPR